MKKNSVSDKEQFQNYLELKVAPSSVKRYMGYYNMWQPLIQLSSINQVLVNEFLIACKNTRTVRAFMRNYLAFIKNKDIEIPRLTARPERKKPKVMTEKEVKLLRDYLYSNGEHRLRNGIMFSLTYNCALRRNELLTIYPDSFQWDDWMEDKSKPCKLKVYGKGRKERFVIVPSKLMQMIELYATRRARDMKEGKTFFGISRSTWDKVVRNGCKNALGKHFKVHEIRITKATHWSEEGLEITQIKNRLGHTDISTTQLYINPDEKKELETWMREVG